MKLFFVAVTTATAAQLKDSVEVAKNWHSESPTWFSKVSNFRARYHTQTMIMNTEPDVENVVEDFFEKEDLDQAELDIQVQNVREELGGILSQLAEADPFWTLNSTTQSDFLVRCLRAQNFDTSACAQLVKSMFEFRSRYRWPYHVTLHDDNLEQLHDFQRAQLGNGQADEWNVTRITGVQLRQALFSGVHWVLPKRDKFDRVVVALRPHKLDLASLSLEVYQLMGVFIAQWSTGLTSSPNVEGTPEGDIGVTIVLDLQHVGLRHVTWFSIDDIKRGIKMWQGTFPVKLRGIYFINVGTIVGGVIRLGTSFLTSKMKDRIVQFDMEDDHEKSSFYDRLGGNLSFIPRSWGGLLDYEDPGDDVSSGGSSHGGQEGGNDGEFVSGWRKVVNETIAAAERARDESDDDENYGWWRDWVSSGEVSSGEA